MAISDALLGTGFAFPFAFDSNTGGVARAVGTDSVDAGLAFIFGTSLQQRVMRPMFGSRLSELLFALESAQTLALVRMYIRESTQLEPRIDDILNIDIQVDPRNPHQLNIVVSYRIITQTTISNLVIPIQSA